MAGDAIGMGERTVAIGLRASATINQSWMHGTWRSIATFSTVTVML